jgi:putative ABC transport system substrate-binding protein
MTQQQVGALICGSDTFLFERREQIVSLAAHYRMPAVYYVRGFAETGGLMTYGNSIADMYLLVGNYVGRIFSKVRSPPICRFRNQPNLNC